MFGQDFEVDAWSRFWRWNMIKICVWTCDMNSTLGSVVPLAMFLQWITWSGVPSASEFIVLPSSILLNSCPPLLWNAVGWIMNNTYSSFLGILHSQDNFFTPFSRLYFRLVWNPSSTFFLFSGPLRTRSTYRDYLSTYKLYSAIPLLPAPYGLVCCFQSHS